MGLKSILVRLFRDGNPSLKKLYMWQIHLLNLLRKLYLGR